MSISDFKSLIKMGKITREWVFAEVYSGYGACFNRSHSGLLHVRVSAVRRAGICCHASNIYWNVFVLVLNVCTYDELFIKLRRWCNLVLSNKYTSEDTFPAKAFNVFYIWHLNFKMLNHQVIMWMLSPCIKWYHDLFD